MDIAVGEVWKLMKRILGIIILSIVFFTAGSIFGTGGIGTKSTTIPSLQTEAMEVGNTTIIDFWTAYKQIEIFVMASQENMETTFNHFREEQMKIAVAGLVNYKSGNTHQLNVNYIDKQSGQINEQGVPIANQKNDFTKYEPLNNLTQINVRTANTSIDPEQLN